MRGTLGLLTGTAVGLALLWVSGDLKSMSVALDREELLLTPGMTPWTSVGGCGAGGSGGGGGDGIKWIGKGVSGGVIQVELMPKFNLTQSSKSFTVAPRLTFKPHWKYTVGLSIPIQAKSGQVQPQTNIEPFDVTTGGTGDVGIDVSRSMGVEGAASLSFALAIPTGQYDIKRGADGSEILLPNSLQKGGGIWSLGVTYSYSKDVENGMWVWDGTFSYPFSIHFSGENQFLDEYFSEYKANGSKDRFYPAHFKPYGENDLGGYTPPSLSASANYAYRGVEHYVHVFGFTFAAPLGVAWIPSYRSGMGRYDPRVDPDHMVWSAALAYGIEFSRDKFPMFLGISLPIHAQKYDGDTEKTKYDPEPYAKWRGPDWSDFGQQWTFAVGLKAAMF